MKAIKLTSFVHLVAILVLIAGCSPQERIAGNYQYKTECLGVKGDGTQTLKAWGSGRNRTDALNQALKNAINDVLFKGITDGKSDCEMRPLITEINARQKYETYFNKFFTDGGEYKQFVVLNEVTGKNTSVTERKEGIGVVVYPVVVIIKRPQLKEKLLQDGILLKY